MTYKIINLSDETINCYFIPEMNFILPGDDKNFATRINNANLISHDQLKLYNFEQVSTINLVNTEWNRSVQIGFQPLVQVHMYTLLSHEYSESLNYHNYQGHCILPCLDLYINALGDQSFILEIQLS